MGLGGGDALEGFVKDADDAALGSATGVGPNGGCPRS